MVSRRTFPTGRQSFSISGSFPTTAWRSQGDRARIWKPLCQLVLVEHALNLSVTFVPDSIKKLEKSLIQELALTQTLFNQAEVLAVDSEFASAGEKVLVNWAQ